MESKYIKMIRLIDGKLPATSNPKEVPDFISFDGTGIFLSKPARKERKLYSKGIKGIEKQILKDNNNK